MKVLLTGASGFVGSHVLDRLRAANIPTTLLLRRNSNPRFIADHLPHVEVRYGSVDDPASLRAALEGVSHVIHCAGATKALTLEGLFEANQLGTRNMVEAASQAGSVRRFVHISSLAAGRSGTRADPARETDPPAPLSGYGRSKLAAEQEVTGGCRGEHVILRPGGVYGPRDQEFLPLFTAARRGFAPVFGGGRQELTLVFAPDLAEAIARSLDAPAAAGQTLNVVAPEVFTAATLAEQVARVVGRRTRRLPLPGVALGVVCVLASLWARLGRRPTVLAHGKRHELLADGWVADASRLRAVLGLVCTTRLADGLKATAAWYRQQGWLPPAREDAGQDR